MNESTPMQRDAALADRPPPSNHPARAPIWRRSRGFWLRQLHSWHWISSALSLVGLLLFTATGFTLNHAADITAEAQVEEGTAQLAPETLARLRAYPEGAEGPIPAEVRREAAAATGLSISEAPAEWSESEVYLAMPKPGGDAWISIDRGTGAVAWETTDRGWIAYLNDLHKGRDTGTVWRWFIDGFVVASLIFIGTGFALLWMHGRNRPATWPLTGLGLLIPFLLALFFIH